MLLAMMKMMTMSYKLQDKERIENWFGPLTYHDELVTPNIVQLESRYEPIEVRPIFVHKRVGKNEDGEIVSIEYTYNYD